MKIAIVGAPGSGKTELAKALDEGLSNATIVDDYAEKIGRENDIAIGGDASYIGKLYVVLGRRALERKAEADGAKHTISCGTMIDSSVYATYEAVSGQTQFHWVRVTNFMNLLGSLFQDTWRYDHVFVLSLDKPEPDTVEGAVDK